MQSLVRIIILFGALHGFLANAKSLYNIELMKPDIDNYWITPDLELNGYRMHIFGFDTLQPLDEIKKYYLGLFEANSLAYEVQNDPAIVGNDKTIISSMDDKYFATVQLDYAGLTLKGLVTIGERLDLKDPVISSDFPKPASFKLSTVKKYNDAGIKAEYLYYTTSSTVLGAYQVLKRTLEAKGWVGTSRHEASVKGRHILLLEMQYNSNHVQAMFMPDAQNDTRIEVIWMKG